MKLTGIGALGQAMATLVGPSEASFSVPAYRYQKYQPEVMVAQAAPPAASSMMAPALSYKARAPMVVVQDTTPVAPAREPAIESRESAVTARVATADEAVPIERDYGPPPPPEEEDDKRKTMWIVGGIAGLVALVGIGYVVMRKKKRSA